MKDINAVVESDCRPARLEAAFQVEAAPNTGSAAPPLTAGNRAMPTPARIFKRFLLTASCVTAFPLAGTRDHSDELGGLSKYLPAVGLLLGVGLAGITWLCHRLGIDRLVQGALLTLAWLAMSGGIHLDGLMDTADGVLSHRSRERMLEIMQDSRVGNFGVMAGVAALLVKFACLSAASLQTLWLVAFLVPVWARWTEALTIGTFPYARESGMGKIWHETTRFPSDIVVAAVIPVVCTTMGAFYAGWQASFCLTTATIVCGYAAARRISHELGGQTGDTYGAVVEIAEAGALLLGAMFLPLLFR